MPTPEIPLIQEHQQEFKVPPELKSELQAFEVKPQVNIQANSQGQPVITNSDSSNVKIQLPDERTLWKRAKKSITEAATWLARFLLRKNDLEKRKEIDASSDK